MQSHQNRDEFPENDGADFQSPSSCRGPILAFMGEAALQGRAVPFVQALGRCLIRNTQFRIATTDYAGPIHQGGGSSAAYTLSRAAMEAVQPHEVRMRLLTFTDDQRPDEERFVAGKPIRTRGKTNWSQRMQMMAQADIVCLFGGSRGTMELFHLALAIEKPVLPLPFSGGAARAAWDEHLPSLTSELGLSASVVARWSEFRLRDASREDMKALAAEVAAVLTTVIRRRCFVMMPFDPSFDSLYDQIILPAMQSSACAPIRIDRQAITGDLTEFLRAQIDSCDVGVAVVTNHNPNVFYELGLAHSLGKPVVLLQAVARADARIEQLPFDIRNHRAIGYPADVSDVPHRERCLGELHDTLRAIGRNPGSLFSPSVPSVPISSVPISSVPVSSVPVSSNGAIDIDTPP